MSNLWIIIRREYLTRVKKKSFFVMTFLGPLMMVLLTVLPVILVENAKEQYNVIVVDNTQKVLIENDTISFYKNKYKSNEMLTFSYMEDVEVAQNLLKDGACDAVLELVSTNDNPPIKSFLYYGKSEISADATSEIKDQTKQIFKNSILRVNYNMPEEDIAVVNDPKIGFYSKSVISGEQSSVEVKSVLGIVLGFVIYFFIFLFASQVMRSVQEEKTSRIIEVLASSVKTVHLLFGKIIATALLGLTQIFLWVVLFLIIIGGITAVNPDIFSQPQTTQVQMTERVVNADAMEFDQQDEGFVSQALQSVNTINFPLILTMFVLYFLLGYLLYSSLFGAIGALLDNDTDNSQFTLPVTAPLILSIICLPVVMNNPTSSLSMWLSIIPFTSPITMLVRLPFGIAFWQVALSIVLLLLTVVFSIWFSAKIYRTGILMYGKNFTWKEVLKWIKK